MHHQRTGDHEQQGKSERVTQRCNDLLQMLEPEDVKKRLETLLAATKGEGDDVEFLARWGYDEQQKPPLRRLCWLLPSELKTQSRLWIAMMKRRMKMNRLM